VADTEWEADAKTAAAQVGCSYRQAGSYALCALLQAMGLPHNSCFQPCLHAKPSYSCSAIYGSLLWKCNSSADCIVGLFCVHNITYSLHIVVLLCLCSC